MPTELKQALRSIEGFSALSDPVLDQLTPFASTRVVRAGETIFCQGEPSPYCFGVLSGEIVIQHLAQDRRFPPKVLGVLGAGHIFGESSIFEDSTRAAMASATKDGKLVAVRGSQLRAWIQAYPEAGQPLLLALLKASVGRLHLTSHELAVIYGSGRLLGSRGHFQEQMSAALEFLKASLAGLTDLALYRRSAAGDMFSPLMSFPALGDLPAIATTHDIVQKVNQAGVVLSFDPRAIRAHLEIFKLPWKDHVSMAVVPLYDWEKGEDPLRGLLFLSSQLHEEAFSAEKLLLLTSVALPFAEALSRHIRQEDRLGA